MADNSASYICLYLDRMDAKDLQRYRERLDHIFDIVDSAENVEIDEDTNESIFRLQFEDTRTNRGKGSYECHEVRVSIVEDMPGAPSPVIRVAALHTNCVADFIICEPLRQGEDHPKIDDHDDILDVIERWTNEASCAFSRCGHIGADFLEWVKRHEANASELLNAVVHAYMEFAADEKFDVIIHRREPYAPDSFHQVLEDKHFEFLSDETRAAISRLLPTVIQLHHTAIDSVTRYWLSAAAEIPLTITAADLPPEGELLKTLEQIVSIPSPHMLDRPIPIEPQEA